MTTTTISNRPSILHINSSSRIKDSITRKVSEALRAELKHAEPQLNVVERDLVSGLPFIDEAWVNANFTPEEHRSDEDKAALSLSDALVAELINAEHIVIASPIYNFNIPAVLKAWVDLIARARLTFEYTNEGPVGLLTGKKATLVMASGGVPIGSEFDLATSYLKQVLAFVGIADVQVIDATKVDMSKVLTEQALDTNEGAEQTAA